MKKKITIKKIENINKFSSIVEKKIEKLVDLKNIVVKQIIIIYQAANIISVFPLGNIICNKDRELFIFDLNFNIIQKILAHENSIISISIKDDNNFVTSSYDDTIKVWIKKDYKFILFSIIENSHKDWIYDVLYCPNNDIISCSFDHTIKIWNKNNKNEYESVTQLMISDSVDSLLLLNDINILISSGSSGTQFWNIYNFTLICNIYSYICGQKILRRLDKNRIIIGGEFDTKMIIIDIFKKNIVKKIENGFKCYGICVLKNKRFFFISGKNNLLTMYNRDNYECVCEINFPRKKISSLALLNNDSFLLSCDDVMIMCEISETNKKSGIKLKFQ